jgi:hypothetical protein
MVFWQLTVDANDPALLARFWAQALGYQPAPPAQPETTWHRHYRARLGGDGAFEDRLSKVHLRGRCGVPRNFVSGSEASASCMQHSCHQPGVISQVE